jgi:hypothetical protein
MASSDKETLIILNSIPLYYKTYNSRYVSLAIILIAIFISGIGVLYTILQYELFNRQLYCDPRYYYGKACNNLIAETVLADPTFLKKKKAFYENSVKIEKEINKDDSEIESDTSKVNNANELSSPEFIEASAKKVDSITDQLNTIKTSYLGNPDNSLRQSISQLNNSFLSELKDLPVQLQRIQDMFTNGIILPSSTHLINALQKLHKSVNDPTWATSPSGFSPGASS